MSDAAWVLLIIITLGNCAIAYSSGCWMREAEEEYRRADAKMREVVDMIKKEVRNGN